jgi:transcriptional regulator with XRE-family HTH domain
MVNSNKIKGRIVELGLTQKDLAKALSVALPTVSQKINNVRSMNVKEAFIIAEVLNIPDKEFRDYFFKEEIA